MSFKLFWFQLFSSKLQTSSHILNGLELPDFPFIRELPDANKHHAATTNHQNIISAVLIFAARVVNLMLTFRLGETLRVQPLNCWTISNVLPLQEQSVRIQQRSQIPRGSRWYVCAFMNHIENKIPEAKKWSFRYNELPTGFIDLGLLFTLPWSSLKFYENSMKTS